MQQTQQRDCLTCELLVLAEMRTAGVLTDLRRWIRTPVHESSWTEFFLLMFGWAGASSLKTLYAVKDAASHIDYVGLFRLLCPELLPSTDGTLVESLQARISFATQLLSEKETAICSLRRSISEQRQRHTTELSHQRERFNHLRQLAVAKAKNEVQEEVIAMRDHHWMKNLRAYTHRGFWYNFPADLQSASKRILIFSPFIHSERIEKLIPVFEAAIAKGVEVKLIIREPKPEQHDLLTKLTTVGVVIELIDHAHQKLAVIDDEILWEGSMNMLSHHGDQGEHMRRIASKEIVQRTLKLHKLD